MGKNETSRTSDQHTMGPLDVDEARLFVDRLMQFADKTGDQSFLLDTADVQQLVREHPDRARKYVTLSCLRSTRDREYLRLAAIVAASYDNAFPFTDHNDSLLQFVIKRSQQLGMDVYRSRPPRRSPKRGRRGVRSA